MMLPSLLSWPAIRERLLTIFPEGLEERQYLVREATARVVFTALYVGAVSGSDCWIAPRHVVRMSDTQANLHADGDRIEYYQTMNRPKAPSPTDRWYAENSREQLRDEVIRQGLVTVNAIIERPGVPTTSPRGRYALEPGFAALFDPALQGDAFEVAAEQWRSRYLSGAALARAALIRASATTSSANIIVHCPSGPSIVLPPGPSPAITKAVIEEFAPRFLNDPRVIWVSDSATKRPFRDAPLEHALEIRLDAAELLPDVVLVDLLPEGRDGQVLIVFVEVVASDGPMTTQRQRALLDLLGTSRRRYKSSDAAFVTAYLDRRADPARRTMPSLAWQSFAWFASEPDCLIHLRDGRPAIRKLAALL